MSATPPQTLSLDVALQQAVAHHQAGRLQEAEQLYRAILQAQSGQPDANHNLGVLAGQVGQPAAGLPYLKIALEANPAQGQYSLSYADALLATGQAGEALNILQSAMQRGLNTPAAQALRQKAEAAVRGGRETGAKKGKPARKSSSKSASPPRPLPQAEFNQLVALFSAGRYLEMENQARLLVRQYPNSGFVWKALGASLQVQGKEALPALYKAAELLPDDAEAHNNLGRALKELGQLAGAVASCRRALEIKPNYAEAHCNLGNALQDLGQFDDAAASHRRALEIKPDYAEAHNNLGIALKDLGQLDNAVASYRRALEIKPDYAEAHNNLGNALQDLGQFDGAVASYRRALEIKPDYAEAHNNLGVVLQDLGQLDSAVASHRRALEIKPDYAEAHSNLGVALKDLGQLDGAVASHRRALEIKPDYAEAHCNLGVALQDLGQLDGAMASYRRALEIKPDYGNAHWNLSFSLLQYGQLTQGWQKYEWRWRKDTPQPKRPFSSPWWQGEDLSGKILLIWGEQGVGDEITFANILPDAIQTCAHCIIECDPRLAPLFARSFSTAEVLPRSTPPQPRLIESDIDFQVPMGNLPRWLRPSIESFPRHHGYLVPDPQHMACWKQRLDTLGHGLKVGVSWRSHVRDATRNNYYTELSEWAPILAVPGVVFVNLQYDECREELREAEQRFGVKIHAFDDIDLFNNLDEAAALTAALDLIIAPSTSVACMASALGKTVWHLTVKHDWSTLGTNAMPWYPDTRLFVKPTQGEWPPVIETLARELATLAASTIADTSIKTILSRA